MGGWVGELAHAVALGGEDTLALHDHGAHRGLAGSGGFGGEIEGKVHGRGHIPHLAFRPAARPGGPIFGRSRNCAGDGRVGSRARSPT